MGRSLEARSPRFAGPRPYNVHEPARCASCVPQAFSANIATNRSLISRNVSSHSSAISSISVHVRAGASRSVRRFSISSRARATGFCSMSDIMRPPFRSTTSLCVERSTDESGTCRRGDERAANIENRPVSDPKPATRDPKPASTESWKRRLLRGRQKKAPASMLGPHCRTVRGVGETRGTARHHNNVSLAEWFRKKFRGCADFCQVPGCLDEMPVLRSHSRLRRKRFFCRADGCQGAREAPGREPCRSISVILRRRTRS